MRILRLMSGYTNKDRIRNENIHSILVVVPIEEEMRDNYSRWFSLCNEDQRLH
jgi:hypothetical protein